MNLLFVCLGNICRSPIAETIFCKLLNDNNLAKKYKVDSAGLDNYHEGELADPRMRRHAEQHGYRITHHSRPITAADFDHFDLILGMDAANIRALLARCGEKNRHKIRLLTDFCLTKNATAIPDPYLGGDADFKYVIEIAEDACKGLLLEIERNGKHA